MADKLAYKVVVEASLDKFLDDVNSQIEEGYRPVGGIMFMEGMYYQAMIEPEIIRIIETLRGL